MAQYECSVCGYVYDEAQEKADWESVPEDWTCPGCGAAKNLFNLLIVVRPRPVRMSSPSPTPICLLLRSPGTR